MITTVGEKDIPDGKATEKCPSNPAQANASSPGPRPCVPTALRLGCATHPGREQEVGAAPLLCCGERCRLRREKG